MPLEEVICPTFRDAKAKVPTDRRVFAQSYPRFLGENPIEPRVRIELLNSNRKSSGIPHGTNFKGGSFAYHQPNDLPSAPQASILMVSL